MHDPIDNPTLNTLRETLGEEFFADVLQVFLQESPMLVQRMHTALKEGEQTEFSRAAHSLKSNAMTLGMNELAAAALVLESMPIVDHQQAGESLDKLAGHLRQASAALMSLAPVHPR